MSESHSVVKFGISSSEHSDCMTRDLVSSFVFVWCAH